MSIARHHAEWLSLVEVSGPFLSIPVLMRIFSQGLPAHDPDHFREIKLAFEEWDENCNAKRPDVAIHHAWMRFVLEKTLEFENGLLSEGQSIPRGLEARVEEHHEIIRPDLAVLEPTATPNKGRPRLLICVFPADQDLERSVKGKHWKASPATRMMALLHATDVPLGLVTNGERWMLVHAPRGETTGFASWYASIWIEEKITLQAFRALLSAGSFFNRPDDETPVALLAESAQDQQEVTDQLGLQVRRAVEVLIRSMDRIDQDRGGSLLAGFDEKQLYEAALTFMMRLVFLFCAEERQLLLLGDPIYDQFYAVSTLRDQLRQAADRQGEEVLERRWDAWSRLLSTFRAVHAGVDHESMSLPAYGGNLFDPDRFPFLEGRERGTSWKNIPANPLPIDNRTVLHLLEALQLLQMKVPGGGPAEARRISFRALDIEQIGHVYEGLLDHTAKRAVKDRPVLGLSGTKGKEPEMELERLEQLNEGEELVKFLKNETGRSESAIKNTLHAELDHDRMQRLRVACRNDEYLVERVKPFARLLRDDTFGWPVVIPGGSVYVTEGAERRSTGTHYTPRSLTEEIVQHTLDPLVFEGPAEGWTKEKWRLRSAREILDLKVCDPAMGSGAFLVQACRYLSERLVEAWEDQLSAHPAGLAMTPFGDISEGKPDEALVPSDPDERLAYARRLVCDRCLFGVDKNPLAVDMAKLSLWLITLDKGRAFTFLDHSLKCGDSLLGLHSLRQLERFHISDDPTHQIQVTPLSRVLPSLFRTAMEKRTKLESFTVNDVKDCELKALLLREADEAMDMVRRLSDLLVGAAISTADGNSDQRDGWPHKKFETKRVNIWGGLKTHYERKDVESALYALKELESKARQMLDNGKPPEQQGRRPFHWPVEFPEVLASDSGYRSGFSAIIGNPPFMGGSKITGVLGTDYRNYIVDYVARGRKGSADLCAYFFLRSSLLLGRASMLGLLSTNTIGQGDTREVGLDSMAAKDWSITRAVSSRTWPGTAGITIAQIWLREGRWKGEFLLDRRFVSRITSSLSVPGKVPGNPYKLAANAEKSFNGSKVYGQGFVLSSETAEQLIVEDEANRIVLFPYLTGEDLNSRRDQSPSRWVINFHGWPLQRADDEDWKETNEDRRKGMELRGYAPPDYVGRVAADFPEFLRIVEEKVKPERDRLNREIRRRRWWQFGERCPKLYETIAPLHRVLVTASVSASNVIAWAATGIVFSHKVIVFAYSQDGVFAVLQSDFHWEWARRYTSTMRDAGLNYSPSDCFVTFPFPSNIESLNMVARSYNAYRESLAIARDEGLTKIYNRFHDPAEKSVDFVHLRMLHVQMDEAVALAYGWSDLEMRHDFYRTRKGMRFTMSESARVEILDRLLALNHERYQKEVTEGLYGSSTKKTKGNGNKKGKKRDEDTISLDF
jgi:hypothetical protein